MGKYKTLAKNTGFVFIGTIGSKVVNFIMLPLYTHWLAPNQFGAVDTMNTYAMFIVGFVCLCIPDSIFIFPRNVEEKKKAEYFSSGLGFSVTTLAGSAILFYIVSVLMKTYGMDNVFSRYVWLIYGLMVTTYFQNYFQSFTRSLDKMLIYSITGIILTFTIAAFSIILIPLLGLYGYVYAMMLANTIAAAYSFFASRSYKYLTIKNSTIVSVKEMLAYSAPLLPNGIMWWLVDGVNRPVMESLLGLSAIGLYSVSQKFSGLLYTVLNILTLAWANSALDEYGKSGFEQFYNNYLKMLAMALVVGGIAICAIVRPLVCLLTTPEYHDAFRYVPVLIIGVIFSGLSGTVGGVFSAVKKSKYFFFSSVFAGLASVIALLVLTPLFGLMGTTISVGFSFFIMLLTRVCYSWKYVKILNIPFYLVLFGMYILLVVLEITVDAYWRFVVYAVVLVVIALLSQKEIKQVVAIAKARIKQGRVK